MRDAELPAPVRPPVEPPATPSADAYAAALVALERHRRRADEAETQRDEAEAKLVRLQDRLDAIDEATRAEGEAWQRLHQERRALAARCSEMEAQRREDRAFLDRLAAASPAARADARLRNTHPDWKDSTDD